MEGESEMKEFKSKISLEDVFSEEDARDVRFGKDSLSHFCKDDVRKGKWFLCYC